MASPLARARGDVSMYLVSLAFGLGPSTPYSLMVTGFFIIALWLQVFFIRVVASVYKSHISVHALCLTILCDFVLGDVIFI